MKVRFAEGAVRCRVTRAELELLVAGRAVGLEVALPKDHKFRVNVRPAAVNGWQLQSDPTGLWLSIPRGEIEALAQTLPSKDGIERSFETSNGGSVTVSFEVDVRDRGDRAKGGRAPDDRSSGDRDQTDRDD